MELRCRGGKAVLDDSDRVLDDTVVGAHTTGMHHGHHGRIEGVEHYGQTVGNQHTQRHVGHAGHQRIGRDTRQTALEGGGIDDAHLVAMHLAHRTQGRLIQTQCLQYTLAVRQDLRVLAFVKAQIEPLF
jgi:hypothetical protein